MKKVLLGTSAIALAGAFASQANAAEWSMKVGGYMEEQMVFTNTDSAPGTDYNGVDFISDGEIHFSPSITLDNGIKFGVRVELEGATNSDQIDENYAYVDGSFGRIVIGEDDNAAYSMAYSAPDVGFYNINSGSDTLSLPFSSGFGTTSTYPSVESDSAGIRYFTPRMAGFQLGASYARDQNKATDDSNKDENAQGKLFNIWAVGANYVNTIGDVSIAASAGYTRGSRNGVDAVAPSTGLYLPSSGPFDIDHLEAYYPACAYPGNPYGASGGDNPPGPQPYSTAAHIEGQHVVTEYASCGTPAVSSSNPHAWQAGLNVGFGGFTVGGSYAKYSDMGSFDRYVYDLGASYETGPWGFSATYLHSKQKASHDKIDKFLLAVDYKLAKGVRLGASGVYEKLNYSGSGSDSGFVLATGMKLNF